MNAREAFEATIGSFLKQAATALDAIADTLLLLVPSDTGIDTQAIEAARDRVNMRSLRRNHPNPEDV